MSERVASEHVEKVWDPEMREGVAQQIEALVDSYGGIDESVRMGIAHRKMAVDLPTKHLQGGEPIFARVYVDRDVRTEYVPKQATRVQKLVNAVIGRSWTEKTRVITKPNAMGIDFYTGSMGHREQGFHPMLHWNITQGPRGDRVVEGIGRALGNIVAPLDDPTQAS